MNAFYTVVREAAKAPAQVEIVSFLKQASDFFASVMDSAMNYNEA
ncbi:MAG: hypothetical protein P3X23_002820 [Thermosynechococcus sp. Uc]|nr:hypothetical protein [Thermosynechococcus sp. Uc]MDM7326041.1 hypothetical protein [Thermosynechococcus sp. Uc]